MTVRGTTAGEIVEAVAEELGKLDGVRGVALGGSRARGTADEGSDIDIGVYYSKASPPSLERLSALAHEWDDRGAPSPFGGFGEWGPWVNGGALLRMRGRKVDVLFRELERVEEVHAACTQGRFTSDYQPGHPHAFHSYIYLGEVHYNIPLVDPEGTLADLKARTNPYPDALAEAVVTKFLWEAGFAVKELPSSADRGDAAYVAGFLFRSIACLVQVLFALNRVYFVNEKGAVPAADGFAARPSRFAQRVTELFARIGEDAGATREAIDEAIALREEVEQLA